MKMIGLLGGTSWPSTVSYYRRLNELAQQRLGGHHSANLLLRSIDYHEIKRRYHTGWAEIPALLQAEIETLAAMGPDCILLCNNTLHKALDQILPKLSLSMPVFHMIELTARHLAERKLRRVLLLGTQFTMEDGYCAEKLRAGGAEVIIPDRSERERIQAMQSRLAQGERRADDQQFFQDFLAEYRELDAAVLACTELPLAITPEASALPLIDPAELQCRAAFAFAMGD